MWVDYTVSRHVVAVQLCTSGLCFSVCVLPSESLPLSNFRAVAQPLYGIFKAVGQAMDTNVDLGASLGWIIGYTWFFVSAI